VHNQAQLTARALNALAVALEGVEHEVICVDNASTESLDEVRAYAARVQRWSFSRNGENLSFSRANNAAAARAAGRTLLFLNNDVIVAPDAIRCLLHEAAGHAPAVIGARLRFPDGRVQHAGIVQMLWGHPSNYGAGGCAADARLNARREHFAVTGALLAVPRVVFERIGGFDERYWFGCEDVDLCLRAREAGARVVYAPAVEGLHVESATLRHRDHSSEAVSNYRVFRETWGRELARLEDRCLADLRRRGIRQVVVFGTGAAAAHLKHRLAAGQIAVAAFTCSPDHSAPPSFEGRPVMPLEHVARVGGQRVVVGTQFYFEVEELARQADPTGEPIWPALDFA
jgi:GT2 family glycosyltransferase